VFGGLHTGKAHSLGIFKTKILKSYGLIVRVGVVEKVNTRG